MQDHLFLLRPSFADPEGGASLFHCPSCARIEGLLSFFPFLRASLIIHYVAFARPRAPIVDLIGMEHQSCPVLVLGEYPNVSNKLVQKSSATGRLFIVGSEEISVYFAETFGISSSHP